MSINDTCCGLGNNSACDTGDTGMMMMATTFVMLQTPAMGIAQAGLIRRKNALSMLMQTMSGFVYGSILWFIGGFSLTFGKSAGGLGIIGNLDNAFFMDVGFDNCYTNAAATSIPGIVFVAFQMMFAVMVPVIVTGAWAERMTFEAFTAFVILWPILVYYPLAHWVWNYDGWLASLGALDFAGGITIHTSSGIAALVVSSILSARIKQKSKESLAHHNLPLTVLGGALIWGGWYSFNGASAFAANGQASLALVNTHISACSAGFIWALITYIEDRHWHLTEIINGALAGLAAITPGSGFTTPGAAFIVGLCAGVLAWAWVRHIGPRLKVDDALDVMALQGVPGIFGSIAVGFTANVYAGAGQGLIDGGSGYLLGIQLLGVAISVVWSGLWTWALMHFIRVTAGIDVDAETEEIGLDLAQIGEQAYDEKLSVHLDIGDEGLANKLCEAAGKGSIAELQTVLHMRASIDMSDYDQRTALHIAAGRGHRRLVQHIVENLGGDVAATDRLGDTPLGDAIRHDHRELTAWLLENGGSYTDLDSSTYFSRNNMFTAASQGNVTLLQYYAKQQGHSVNEMDYDRRTPLHLAATEGNADCVQWLLDNKADVLVSDRWGYLPIGNASRHRFTNVLDILRPATETALQKASAAKGGPGDTVPLANVAGEAFTSSMAQAVKDQLEQPSSKVDTSTRLLIDAAARSDTAEIKALLAKRANVNGVDYDGRTALHLAAACNHVDVVRLLVRQRELVVNVFDRFDITPLNEAMQHGESGEAIVKLLLANGAVPVDALQGSRLCSLAAAGDLGGLKELVAEKVDVNFADYDGRTALHLAACEDHADIVTWLLDRGSKPNVRDRFGNTAEDDATRHKSDKTIEVLRPSHKPL